MAWYVLRLMMLTSILVMSGSTALAQEEEEASVSSDKGTDDASKSKKKKDKDKKKGPPLYYASLGIGKTLPEGFYRFRSINRFSKGNTGYDGSGTAENFGYDLTANANIFAVEYGMSDRFGFLILLPYVSKNNVAFTRKQFKESNRYKTSVAEYTAVFKSRLGEALRTQGACSGEACAAAVEAIIARNDTLPSSTLTLPTGEVLTLPASAVRTTLESTIPDLVTKAATPADGVTGLGDIDIGINYSLVATRMHVMALGVGIRLPLGKFEDVPTAQRPTGEGLMQLGLRFNYDYHPIPPLWLSFQNQSQFMLMEGRRKKSSLVDPSQLNRSDPTTDAAVSAGSDGDPNSQAYSQKGSTQLGLLRADFGLAKISPVLQPMAVEAALNYRFGAAEYYGSKQTNPGDQRLSYTLGFKFDGLGLERPYPAYVRILREKFIKGKNVSLATDSYIFEFTFYQGF